MGSPAVGLGLVLAMAAVLFSAAGARAEDLLDELKHVPYKIVYETWRGSNWNLYLINADGSNPVNLTRDPQANELYPHVSPDGTKLAFTSDEGEGQAKTRSLYYRNIDGSGRTLVAKNARDFCWNADGTAIAYLPGEFEKFTYADFASKGLCSYDLASGKQQQHPNGDLHHLYCLCWSPDENWFLATVHAGMGFQHAILVIEAKGMGVFNLKIPGCRPDISPDGKRLAWGAGDFTLSVADLDFTGPQPKVINRRDIVTSQKPDKIYHIDWSPDGKYVAFSRGPTEKRLGLLCEFVGVQAEGWNICVADPTQQNRWVAITSDGNSNKEPDWVPLPKREP
jgi:Tol biopolymer transport system component